MTNAELQHNTIVTAIDRGMAGSDSTSEILCIGCNFRLVLVGDLCRKCIAEDVVITEPTDAELLAWYQVQEDRCELVHMADFHF